MPITPGISSSPITGTTGFAASAEIQRPFVLPSIVTISRGGRVADIHHRNIKTAASALCMSTTAEPTSTTPATLVVENEDSMGAATKLSALRKSMKDLDLDVYLVPSDDPHLSGPCTAEVTIE